MNLHLSATRNHFTDHYGEGNIAEIKIAFGYGCGVITLRFQRKIIKINYLKNLRNIGEKITVKLVVEYSE